MFESEDGRANRALASALAASALLVAAAVAVRVVGRPLVPVWLIVLSGLGALAGLAALILRMREAAADAAADGSAAWSSSQAPSAIVTTGVILASAAFMLVVAAFIGLKDGGPIESRPDCQFPLNNKGAGPCVDEATYRRAGASEQSLFLSVVAAFIACETVAFACTKDTGRSSPIWVDGTREADWD